MSYSLYTEATPNPLKIHIALHEINTPYQSVHVDFGKDEQKSDHFLEHNPNGRIPVLIDHDADDFTIIESGAILIYLAEKHGKLLPYDSKQRSEALQWLMWQVGGLGPMFGQLLVFAAAFDNSIPEATRRYDLEVKRLLDVLDTRLQGRNFIAHDYSIADIAVMGWIPMIERIGWNLETWPNVHDWFKRCTARPAYQKAIQALGQVPEDERMKNFRRATIGLES